MIFLNEHWGCNESECNIRAAYIRIERKWTKIGYYNTGCKTFEPLDPIVEKKDRKFREKIREFELRVMETKVESAKDLKDIRKRLNTENTHFSYLDGWDFE